MDRNKIASLCSLSLITVNRVLSSIPTTIEDLLDMESELENLRDALEEKEGKND